MTQPTEYIPFESKRVLMALKEISDLENQVLLLAKMARDNEGAITVYQTKLTELNVKTTEFLKR